MLDSLLVLVVSLHLLAVGVAVGGPFVCIWLEWRESRRGDALAGQMGRKLARHSMVVLTVGILLGAAALGLLWQLYPAAYFGALKTIEPSRLWLGSLELAFWYGCMGAYLGLWQRLARWRSLHRLIALAAGTNLAYHFPFLFATVAVLSTRPELWTESFRFRSMLLDAEVLLHATHDVLAALVVTGVFVMSYAPRLARSEGGEADARQVLTWGARLALPPTLLQLPVGLGLLIELPYHSRAQLLGSDPFGTLLFGLGLLAVIGLLHHLAAASLGDGELREARRSMLLVALVILLMVSARHRARLPKFESIERDAQAAQRQSMDVDDQAHPDFQRGTARRRLARHT